MAAPAPARSGPEPDRNCPLCPRLVAFRQDWRAREPAWHNAPVATFGSLDARLVLSGDKQVAGTRPDIFMALKGPLPSPKRSIDVSALTGWLTLRAVDNQTRQIREFENAQRQARPPALNPKSELAPTLPAPVEIRRLPALKRRGLPEASANGAQN